MADFPFFVCLKQPFGRKKSRSSAERVLVSTLIFRYIPPELAPYPRCYTQSRLPGFIGPIPPPLLIRLFNYAPYYRGPHHRCQEYFYRGFFLREVKFLTNRVRDYIVSKVKVHCYALRLKSAGLSGIKSKEIFDFRRN